MAERETRARGLRGFLVSFVEQPPAICRPSGEPGTMQLINPEKIIFVPGSNEPIFAFSFQNIGIRRQEMNIDGKKVRMLSIEAQAEKCLGHTTLLSQSEFGAAALSCHSTPCEDHREEACS